MTTNMTGKIRFARLFNFALGMMLLFGLFFMPSMQAGFMTTAADAGTFYENAPAGHGHNMPNPCCGDAAGSLVMTCGVLIPYFAWAAPTAGIQRVALSPLFVHITHRDTATPPPKI